MFTKLCKHLVTTAKVDYIDLAILETIESGPASLKQLAEAVGQRPENAQFAYARVRSLAEQGWLTASKPRKENQKFRSRSLTPEGKKRMAEIRKLLES